MIEKLYGHTGVLLDDDKDLTETLAAYDRFYEVYGQPSIGEQDEALGNLALMLERQGFLSGFRLAVAIMTDRG